MSYSIQGNNTLNVLDLPCETMVNIFLFSPTPRNSLVCKEFQSCNSIALLEHIKDIFNQCATGNSSIDIFINALQNRCKNQADNNFETYLQLNSENVLRMYRLIVRKIQNYGIECPNRILKLHEILQYKEEVAVIEDRNLQKAWVFIRAALPPTPPETPALMIPPDDRASAEDIRTWMQANQAVLRGVVILDLSGKELTCVPREIGLLTGLKTINLSRNQLRDLPEDVFGNLAKLRRLNLSHNQLGELSESVFDGLTKLVWLNLSHNRQGKLPEGLFNGLTNLKKVCFSKNQLFDLPQGLFHRLMELISLCG